MHRFLAAIIAICLAAGAALAQLPPPPPGGPGDATDAAKPAHTKKKIENKADKKSEAAAKEAAAASTDDIVPLAGDTVYFKNGSVLKGVKVIRESPSGVDVQVTDADTLMIPRKQIDHIDYKKAEEPKSPEAAAAEMSILKGQKVSTELYGKLTTELPDGSLELKEADFITALGDIAKKTGVTIEVTDPVKKIPAKERLWTTKLEKGAKLSNLLDDLLSKFSTLQLDFPNDKIVVSVSSEAPAAAPAK